MTSGLMMGDRSSASVWEGCRCWRGRRNAVCARVCERVWVDDDTFAPPPSPRVSRKGTQLSVWSEKPIREIVCVTICPGLQGWGGWHGNTLQQRWMKPPLRVPHPIHRPQPHSRDDTRRRMKLADRHSATAGSQSGPAAEGHSNFLWTPSPPRSFWTRICLKACREVLGEGGGRVRGVVWVETPLPPFFQAHECV